MKKTILTTLLLLAAVLLFSQELPLTEIIPAYGEWVQLETSVKQLNDDTGLAKLNLEVSQKGKIRYDFTVKYIKGGYEDLMGGFGVHLFVDKPHNGISWGNGQSYLLWLNYDDNATYGGKGFRAQVYKTC